MATYAIVDVETFGLTPNAGPCPGLVSVACGIMDEDLNLVEVRSWKVAVSVESALQAHPKAIEANGWTPEGWADAEDLDVVMGQLAECIEGRNFVAHNATFDLAWVRASFEAAGVPMPRTRQVLCTMAMGFPLKATGQVESVSLDRLGAWAGVGRDTETHEAGEDVRITAAIFRKLCGK